MLRIQVIPGLRGFRPQVNPNYLSTLRLHAAVDEFTETVPFPVYGRDFSLTYFSY